MLAIVKLFLAVFFIMAAGSSLAAQIVYQGQGRQGFIHVPRNRGGGGGGRSIQPQTMAPQLIFEVRDSASHQPVAGAVVTVKCGENEVHGEAGTNGRVVFPNKYLKDTVDIKVRMMGYREMSGRFTISTATSSFYVGMKEDPTMLNSIIVQGDAVAMVMHGDTTVFNASAFKTMKGDPLENLLKKLPGVTIEDGVLMADGKQVTKILINGSSLFGNNVNRAMSLVYGDDVKSVKLFEEHDRDRLLESDTLKAKETVMDVRTKKPMNGITSTHLSFAGGAYTDKDDNGKAVTSGRGSVSFNRFKKDQPRISAGVSGSKNTDGNNPSTTPNSNLGANFNMNHRFHRKAIWSVYGNAGHAVSANHGGFTSTWMDNSSQAGRKDLRENDDGSTNKTFRFGANYGRAFKENSLLGNSMEFSMSAGDNESERMAQMLRAGVVASNELVKSNSSSHSFSGSYGGNYGLRRGKGQSFGVSWNIGASKSSSEGARLDTLAKSTRAIWLTNENENWSVSPSISVNFRQPVTETIAVMASWNTACSRSEVEDNYLDRILNQVDSINSKTYKTSNLNHSAYLGLDLGTYEGPFHAGVHALWHKTNLSRDEAFPYDRDARYSFDWMEYNGNLRYQKEKIKFNASAGSSASIPSINSLRNYIDNSSTLSLSSGNPDLKMSRSHYASMSLVLTTSKIATNWQVNANGAIRENSVVNKLTTFDKETTIPGYGYTFAAGSILSRPVNAGTSRSCSVSFSTSTASGFLKGSFSPRISYAYSDSPYYLGEELKTNRNRSSSFGINYESNFSDKFEISTNYGYGLSKETNQGEKIYDQNHHTAGLSIHVLLLEHLDGRINFNYTRQSTDSGFDNEIFKPNARLSYRFGEKLEKGVGIVFYDFLNKSNSRSISVQEEFIRESFNRIYGRAILLSFFWDIR